MHGGGGGGYISAWSDGLVWLVVGVAVVTVREEHVIHHGSDGGDEVHCLDLRCLFDTLWCGFEGAEGVADEQVCCPFLVDFANTKVSNAAWPGAVVHTQLDIKVSAP